MSNIFIPNRINVGFQNREGTYTGKLAYIIYWDEKGKLRKETSWNHWRNKEIPNEEYDNKPTEGFVLNKKVGGYSGNWGNFRQAYTRVYDPRGFEFEITIPNLIWILECCNCIKGKGLEGEFVYGWDGTDLLLVPVDSPDYKEIKAHSEKVNRCTYIDKNDLKVGATYVDKKNVKYVYMGRFDKYEYCYFKDGKREYASIGKYYCFGYYSSYGYIYFKWIKSVKDRFIDIVNEDCSEKYAELYEELEKNAEFSPPDFTKNKIIPVSYEQFEEYANHYCNTNVMYKSYDEYKKVTVKKIYNKDDEKYEFKLFMGWDEVLDMFPIEGKHMIPVTLREIYDKIHPVYRVIYLANGNKYREEYTW